MRRALLPSLGVALVVAAEAALRSFGTPVQPLVFVPYSVLIWAVFPVVVAVAIVGVSAFARNAELPMWFAAAAVAGLATATWVSWGIGLPAGLVHGLVLGLAGAGTGLALGARWRASVRVLTAVAIVTASVLVLRSVG